MSEKMDEAQKERVRKVISGIMFCTLSTCSEGEPHTTIVQHTLTSEFDIIIIAKKTRKKISNIKQNDRVWLTFDATGSFKIPKAIYVEGKAKLSTLNQENFDEFLSYHEMITKKIYKKLTAEGFEHSTRIVIKPEKIITIGIFDKLDNAVSFTL